MSMNPNNIMQMLAFLDWQRKNNDPGLASRKRRKKRGGGGGGRQIVTSNPYGTEYDPKKSRNFANSNQISRGPGLSPPDMPDVGFGPNTPPPSSPMTQRGAGIAAGGLQAGLAGLGQMPPHLQAMLGQQLSGGRQGPSRAKRRKRDKDLLKEQLAFRQLAFGEGQQPPIVAGGQQQGPAEKAAESRRKRQERRENMRGSNILNQDFPLQAGPPGGPIQQQSGMPGGLPFELLAQLGIQQPPQAVAPPGQQQGPALKGAGTWDPTTPPEYGPGMWDPESDRGKRNLPYYPGMPLTPEMEPFTGGSMKLPIAPSSMEPEEAESVGTPTGPLPEAEEGSDPQELQALEEEIKQIDSEVKRRLNDSITYVPVGKEMTDVEMMIRFPDLAKRKQIADIKKTILKLRVEHEKTGDEDLLRRIRMAEAQLQNVSR